MEDYLIREIDRIGELLIQTARRLGLFGGQRDIIPIEDVKSGISSSGLDLDIDELLQQGHPVLWLVEQKQYSDKALGTVTDILMNSVLYEELKRSIMNDSVSYLDSKGYFSFLLHSY